jgi:hypothetical protein
VDILTIRIVALVLLSLGFVITIWLMVRLFQIDVPKKPVATGGEPARQASEAQASETPAPERRAA